ncbi:nitrogenase iron-molybdenum cofactor biosynthesis protein NifN [Mongoliimonas terrestris]|uniref:nitrogenase iron-molybdenum cofactor biosynthesis protein NifN n=1 Tax=Mongoliimonas terrestris TaxID=1709001 RepID=UPI0009496FE9|nr:nitrogenase iron-molybdenum cofactor biosynthesis protein NifN [Mongoliimonas terrestris]
MSIVVPVRKSATVNPLKQSAPLGAAMAYLGVEGAVPLFHGSQGCTAFALVLMVRHFKETIPIQTTAMNEVSTILGGADHLEEALLNLKSRMKPKLIGIASTALTETRGEDMAGEVRTILKRRADDLAGTTVVYASTPDFTGALEEGWAKATEAVIAGLVPETRVAGADPLAVNILVGQHLTPGDIEAVRDLVESFGLTPTLLPDISLSLDGTVPDAWVPTSYGGTPLAAIGAMGRAAATFAIGEHMAAPGRLLADRTGVPLTVQPSLTGLEAADAFVAALARLSGRPVPERQKRERSRLVDAMLDGHLIVGERKVAVAAEPDLLFAVTTLLAGLGARIVGAVSTAVGSRALERIPAEEVLIGDLGDLERLAREGDADLIATHSHGRQAAERLHRPHLRIGFPIFDRLGSQHKVSVGYAGTRALMFEIANLFQAEHHAPSPAGLDPFRDRPVPAALSPEPRPC